MGPSRICAPADSIIAVAQTVKPSYRSPWTWISPPSPISSAAAIISSQVLGALSTRSLRYQRSCVFDVNGAA